MSVVNIPPDGSRVYLGQIPGNLNIYNMGKSDRPTKYFLVIGLNALPEGSIAKGDTQTFACGGAAANIRNQGPDTLQCMFEPADDAANGELTQPS